MNVKRLFIMAAVMVATAIVPASQADSAPALPPIRYTVDAFDPSGVGRCTWTADVWIKPIRVKLLSHNCSSTPNMESLYA